jgi:23S rRNA (adenine2503-C2)-methyltransferase
VFAAVHRGGAGEALDADDIRGLSPRVLAELTAGGAAPRRIEVLARRRSERDNFTKYLFRLRDGEKVEAVRIPLPAGPEVTPEKFIVCVSSQAGCALRCAFCATGKLGHHRHLETWEIVEQVARIRDEAPAPVRGIVFMGMGEPFLNFDRVIRAAGILSDPAGFAIGQKAITISTAGIVPSIRRFTAEGHRYRLAVSLTSAIPEKRRRLMPIEAKYPLPMFLEAVRNHAAVSGDRVLVQYVMIPGVNMGEEDAAALVAALGDIPVRLTLIEVNDASGVFTTPTLDEIRRFRSLLDPLAQPISRRYSGGREIEAACGMLAATG